MKGNFLYDLLEICWLIYIETYKASDAPKWIKWLLCLIAWPFNALDYTWYHIKKRFKRP